MFPPRFYQSPTEVVQDIWPKGFYPDSLKRFAVKRSQHIWALEREFGWLSCPEHKHFGWIFDGNNFGGNVLQWNNCLIELNRPVRACSNRTFAIAGMTLFRKHCRTRCEHNAIVIFLKNELTPLICTYVQQIVSKKCSPYIDNLNAFDNSVSNIHNLVFVSYIICKSTLWPWG